MSVKRTTYVLVIFCLLAAVFVLPRNGSAAPPQYTLTTTVVGSGSVDPAGGTYNKNNVVTITAIPDAG